MWHIAGLHLLLREITPNPFLLGVYFNFKYIAPKNALTFEITRSTPTRFLNSDDSMITALAISFDLMY